jgi:hypothetical protein
VQKLRLIRSERVDCSRAEKLTLSDGRIIEARCHASFFVDDGRIDDCVWKVYLTTDQVWPEILNPWILVTASGEILPPVKQPRTHRNENPNRTPPRNPA